MNTTNSNETTDGHQTKKSNKGKDDHGKGQLKARTTRTSRSFCEERYACKGNKPEAVFYCRECGTFQCEICEELLHENSRFVFHERDRVKRPSEEIICQNKCQDKNFADVHCVDCNKNCCFSCDTRIHSSQNNKRHVRQPFQQVVNTINSTETEEFYSMLTNEPTNVNDENKLNMRSKTNLNINPEPRKPTAEPFQASLPDIAQLSLDPYDNSETHLKYTSENNINLSKHGQLQTESFLLVDEFERMQVENSEQFAQKLGCPADQLIKVVSIFGNTGEGKSHTLNYTFYSGKEIFKTSPAQSSCTIGIWASYDQSSKVICIDTEGLLGISENNNRRTRLLLKVLAVSDVIIYRTRAERLHNDLFTFLGDASRAYVHHFSKELRAASQRCNLSCTLSDLGPVIVIFHETVHTDTLHQDMSKTPEDVLRHRFQSLGLSIEAFSAFEYVGTQTFTPPTDFNGLQQAVHKHLLNTTVRSARSLSVVFNALKLLNEKFSGDIEKTIPCTFPDQYFTCCSQCLSCNVRCTNSMNHTRDYLAHKAEGKCKYQHQFDNRLFYCKACYDRGDEILVIPKTTAANESAWLGLAKYAWSGYVLECTQCGIIYRSRQYWYGNQDPWDTVVRTEIRHIWPGEEVLFQGSQNAAQRVLDGVGYLSETVTTISAKPTKMLSSWVADQIAPTYWIPNARIMHCGICHKEFSSSDHKHHCRACGGGFCEDCSSKARPVPERGWGDQPVRVCDQCYEVSEHGSEPLNPEITARKVGEVLQTTIGTVVSAIDYPREWIKDSARPEYWIPDKDIDKCFVCSTDFSEKIPIHHCRDCGNGVCDTCSQSRKTVPNRGWDRLVRVCDECVKKPNASI